MKEFIEKLIARLEEHCGIANEVCYCDGVCSECDFRASIEIVKELAQEHNNKTMIDGQYCWQTCGATERCKECNRLCNGSIDYYENYDVLAEEYKSGWIPCSERLPEIDGNTSDTVLVCAVDGYRHMAFWCDDGKWRYCESGEIKKPIEWVEIIAWQPLPEPYQSKED